jgi:hypothetical protein
MKSSERPTSHDDQTSMHSKVYSVSIERAGIRTLLDLCDETVDPDDIDNWGRI